MADFANSSNQAASLKESYSGKSKKKKLPRFANGGRVPDDYESKTDEQKSEKELQDLLDQHKEPVKMAEGGDALSALQEMSHEPIEQQTAEQPTQAPTPEELESFVGPEMRQEKYGTPGQQLKAGLEGAAEGIAGPLATLAETKSGLTTPEDIAGRREANSITHGAGQIAGLAGSLATGVGEGALAVRGAEALVPKLGETIAARMGSTMAKASIENMAIQAGDETTKMILNDPEQSAQTAIADIGLAGLIGGSIGGVLSGVSPLWKATAGNKAGQFIEDFKSRIQQHLASPDPEAALTNELSNHYQSVTKLADEVYGPTGIKAQDIAKAMPEMNDKMVEQVTDNVGKLQDLHAKMNAKPEVYPPRLTAKLDNDLNNYLNVATHSESTPADLFNATQDLKQTLQGYAKFDKFVKPVDEAYDFVREAKSLSHQLRTSLEDEGVWGNAAKRQTQINKAFKDYLPHLKDFERKFTVEVGGERQIDPAKVTTYMKQIDKSSGETKRQMLGNFIDASNKYKDVIGKSHANLGIESPIEHSSLHHVMDSLKERTAGARIADYFIEKGLSDISSKSLGGATGGTIGHLFGHSGLGALIGTHALAPFYNSVLPALIKPMVESMSSSSGIKAAVDYGMSVAKGQSLLNRASKDIFKAGRMTLPSSAIPSDKDTDKLDKLLKSVQKSPNQMLEEKGDVGHYLPGHDTAINATAMNAINYLNQLRPNSVKQTPLDSNYKLSNPQKSQFKQQLVIAQQPLTVLPKIKDGSITLTDINTLRSIYPSLYKKLSSQIQQDMMEHVSKGDSVPYKTRIGLSMFTGQPMDSTFLPQNIIATQPLPQQPPVSQPQPGQKAKGSPKALDKMAGEYKTPAQNRQQNLQTKD